MGKTPKSRDDGRISPENGQDAVQERLKKCEALDGPILKLVSESDPHGLMTYVAETAASLIDAETVTLPTLSPDNLEVRYDYACGKHKDIFLGLSLPIERAGLCGWVIENRRAIMTDRLQDDPRVKKEMARELGITTALLVPLIARGRIIGGISAFNKTDGSSFVEEDADMLARLANYAAVAIDDVRLIEALKTEKVKLSATLNSVRDGVLLLSRDGTIMNANKAMEQYIPIEAGEMAGANVREFADIEPLARLFDWKAKAHPGRRCWEVLGCGEKDCPVYSTDILRCWAFSDGHCYKVGCKTCGEDKAWDVCAHCEVISHASRGLSVPREVRVMGKDLQVSSNLTATSSLVVMDPAKDVFGEVMVFRDITAKRRLERQRSEFISMITHELKTPVTSIMGNCEFMLEEHEPGKIRKAGLAAIENSKDLMKMINEFLELYKAESGNISLNPIRVSPGSILSSLHQQYTARASEMRVDLTWEVADKTPDLKADLDLLSRIIGNLIKNALKQAHVGGAITMRADSTARGIVAISVEDDGPGISQEDLPVVFDIYFPGRERHRAGSLSLGLATAKVLTEAQGGEVSVKSKAGQGSVFTVLMPAWDRPAASDGIGPKEA